MVMTKGAKRMILPAPFDLISNSKSEAYFANLLVFHQSIVFLNPSSNPTNFA